MKSVRARHRAPKGPAGKVLLLGLGTLVAVVAAHEVRHVQQDVLLEVGGTVPLTRVHVTDDHTNLGVTVDAGLPGLQTDAVGSLLALVVRHFEGVGQLDGGDDGAVVHLREGNSHSNS